MPRDSCTANLNRGAAHMVVEYNMSKAAASCMGVDGIGDENERGTSCMGMDEAGDTSLV